MTDSHNQTPPTLLFAESDLLAFTAVPQERNRYNGWTPAQQERFIRALAVMGSVRPALQAVGLSKASAYKLRE